MRTIREVLILIDGGATPKLQFKNIISDGATENDYTATEYPVDSSGDTSLYFKIIKN